MCRVSGTYRAGGLELHAAAKSADKYCQLRTELLERVMPGQTSRGQVPQLPERLKSLKPEPKAMSTLDTLDSRPYQLVTQSPRALKS